MAGRQIRRKRAQRRSAFARRAAELDQDEALALSWAGMTLTHLLPDSEEGAALLERALALNTNLMQAWYGTGWVRIRTGQPEAAIEAFKRAMRLSPLDPFTFAMQHGIALAHFLAGRYDQASLWAEKTLRAYHSDPGALRVAAASNALAGRPEEARRAIGRLRQREPGLRVSNLRSPSGRTEDLAKLAGALRIAGLPE
jgi:tetratricopeptide (TPR) repeat protein